MSYRYTETYEKDRFTPKQQELLDAMRPHTINYKRFITHEKLLEIFGSIHNAQAQMGYMKARLGMDNWYFCSAYGLGYALVRKGTRHD